MTLVKSPTTWLLFDDDSVEPVKEADIPKYFGDSAFTVEAAVNAAKEPPVASPATAAPPPLAAPNASAMAMMGIGGGPAGGALIPSHKILATSNSNVMAYGPAGMKPSASNGSVGGQTGATNPPPQASIGSGYVLFYQAVDLDLKGLGLVQAAKEAKEAGTAMLKAQEEAAKTEPAVTEVPEAMLTNTTATSTTQIFVEEPEEEPRLIAGGGPSASPNFTATSSSPASVTIPLNVPASPSGLTATTSGSSERLPKAGLSLDLPPPSLGPTSIGVEDQLSPLILPPPSNGGGFFKSLKHSASVNVGSISRPSGSGIASGFGLGLSAPTKPPSMATGASSTPALLDVKPKVPPPPTVPKDKEEKEKGGNWFSTARKSVKRKSKNKEKENDDREKDLHGTSSIGSSVASEVPPLPPSASANLKRPAVPILSPPVPEASSFAGDGAPASAGVLLPPPSMGVKSLQEERRASEPATILSPPPSLSAVMPDFPRKFSGDDTTLRIPKSPSPPSAFTGPGSVPSSPVKNGRFAPPRKSLTLLDNSPNTTSFAVGLSPIPREPKEVSGGTIGGGLMKRASRKMSLNSSSMRLSGFGWGKDKDHRHAS